MTIGYNKINNDTKKSYGRQKLLLKTVLHEMVRYLPYRLKISIVIPVVITKKDIHSSKFITLNLRCPPTYSCKTLT